jgi:HSP20 family protein
MLRFEPFGDLDREIGRFIDQQRRKRPIAQFGTRGWQPAMDLFETEDMLVAVMELAGVDQESLELILEQRSLRVRGERRPATQHQPHSYHVIEIPYGPFERAVPLPAAVDTERTTAQVREGMLEICMPKHQSQRISINVTWLETESGR